MANFVKEIPELPEFCEPVTLGEEQVWLSSIVASLENYISHTQTRIERNVDKQVAAAVFLYLQIIGSEELQREWCDLPGWKGRKKVPKKGNIGNLLEEVFRYLWVLVGGDQDGYELRYTVVKHVFQPGMDVDGVIEAIRTGNGYVAIRKSIREAKRLNGDHAPALANKKIEVASLPVHEPVSDSDHADNEADYVTDVDVDVGNGSKARVWFLKVEVSERVFISAMNLAEDERSEPIVLVRRGDYPDGLKRLKAVRVKPR